MKFNIIFLLVFSIHFLGCSNSSHSQPEKAAEILRGTGDGGGGGNGVANRIYESYIVNPLRLSAFEKYIKPIISALNSNKGRYHGAVDLEILVIHKTWFIAPVKFKPLDHETLGIEFAKSDSQQLARQTNSEIWIDSEYYSKMTEEDQAKLILHEIIMSFYLARNKKTSELCRIFLASKMNDEACPTDLDDILINDAKKLSPIDYSNIRAATGWIWLKRLTLNQDEAFRHFLDYQFDSRIFGQFFDVKKLNLSLPNFTNGDAIAVVEKAILLNKAPTYCKGLKTTFGEQCKVAITGPQNGATETTILVSALGPSIGILFRTEVDSSKRTWGFRIKNFYTNEYFVIYPLLGSGNVASKKGTGYKWVFLVMKENTSITKETLTLNSILTIPGVITKVSSSPTGDVCYGERPKPTGLNDDLMVVTEIAADTRFLSWLGENLQLAVICGSPIL